jgi:hypothetical protein
MEATDKTATLQAEEIIKSLPKEISKEEWEQINASNHSPDLQKIFKIRDESFIDSKIYYAFWE